MSITEALNDLAALPAIDRLAALRLAPEQVRRAIESTVAELRRNGVTWTTIGEALGTTRQGAQLRFRDVATDVPEDKVVWVGEATVKVEVAGTIKTVSWDGLRRDASMPGTASTGRSTGKGLSAPAPTAATALADRYAEILHQANRRVEDGSPVEMRIRRNANGQDALESKWVWGGGSAPGDGLSNTHGSWVEEQRDRFAADLRRSGHKVTIL